MRFRWRETWSFIYIYYIDDVEIAADSEDVHWDSGELLRIQNIQKKNRSAQSDRVPPSMRIEGGQRSIFVDCGGILK